MFDRNVIEKRSLNVMLIYNVVFIIAKIKKNIAAFGFSFKK